jgi:hypothetical protein
MAAAIVNLRTKPDRLHEEQAAALRQLVLDFPGLPERATGEIVAAIDRQTASKGRGAFVMMWADQNAAVVRWLMAHSGQPMKATQLWAECFTVLRTDTNEIMATREELAERVKVRPNELSTIMSELESFGAISRRREKVPGMRGQGVVRYYMNPRVGTHLAGAARDKAQEAAPPIGNDPAA